MVASRPLMILLRSLLRYRPLISAARNIASRITSGPQRACGPGCCRKCLQTFCASGQARMTRR